MKGLLAVSESIMGCCIGKSERVPNAIAKRKMNSGSNDQNLPVPDYKLRAWGRNTPK